MTQATDKPRIGSARRISKIQLARMTKELFVTMLDLPLDVSTLPPLELNDSCLQASVAISGDENCVFHVFTLNTLARQIACAMFAMEDDELTDQEVNDALGEVANVVGGSVKGTLGGDTELSLPHLGPQTFQRKSAVRIDCISGNQPLTIILSDA